MRPLKLIGAAVVLVACGSETTGRVSVAKVELSPAFRILEVGDSIGLSAVPRDERNTALNRRVRFSTSADSIASVDAESGQVRAIAAGTAQITATSEAVQATAIIIVTSPTSVTQLVITPAAPTVNVGEALGLTAIAQNRAGEPVAAPVRWFSNASTIATVDSVSGVVTGVAGGLSTITARAEDASANVNVLVTQPASITQIVLAPAAPSVQVGSTLVLTAIARDSTGAAIPAAIRWSSSVPSIATIDSVTGVVTALVAGRTTVTARAGAVRATVDLLVTVPTSAVASLEVTPSVASISTGRALAFSAVARNTDGTTVPATIRWTSGNLAVARIDSVTGVATGVAQGEAAITARSGTISATVVLQVTPTVSLVAELPRLRVNTVYVPPTGRQLLVPAGGNLQTAIDTAVAGDEILLAPGATYTGNFVLRRKAGTAVIHIRTDLPIASLPPQGTRMTPATAAALNLAKIVSNVGPAIITTQRGASNYRLIGVEMTLGPSGTPLNSLIRLGDHSNTHLDSVSTNLIIDRSYLHGTTDGELIRAVIISSSHSAVIDSYLSDCHATGTDAQAIVSWTSPGPLKIENNYLEASSENILIGGSDAPSAAFVPADIEILRNHLDKPGAWLARSWVIKNLFELKVGTRVLVEGNVMTHNWAAAQAGFAVNIKSTNQTNAPWSITKDVTFRYNFLANVGAGLTLAGKDPNPVDSTTRRILVTDNLVQEINVSPYDGTARILQIVAGNVDLIIDHNTFISSGTISQAITLDGLPSATTSTITNNVFLRGSFGIKGAGTAEGIASLNTFMPGVVFAKNAVIGADALTYPADNFYPTDIQAVGFADPANRNYTISSGQLVNAGTDGRTVGADIATLMNKIAGVVVP